MDASTLKQLKVKVGSLKRNVKDIEYAEKELDKEGKRLAEYEAANDEDKVFQQKKVVDEFHKMIPINMQRLKTLFEEASQFSNDLPPAPIDGESKGDWVPAAGDDEETLKKKQQGAENEAKQNQADKEGRESLKEALDAAKTALKNRNIDVSDSCGASHKAEGDDADDY
jgi:hypothetical protein